MIGLSFLPASEVALLRRGRPLCLPCFVPAQSKMGRNETGQPRGVAPTKECHLNISERIQVLRPIPRFNNSIAITNKIPGQRTNIEKTNPTFPTVIPNILKRNKLIKYNMGLKNEIV